MEDKKNNNNNLVSKVVAGAAVIGGVVAAVALSNKDNRDNLKKEADKVAKKVGEKGAEVVEDLKDKGQQIANKAVATVVEEYNVLKQKLEDFLADENNKAEADELRKSAEQIGASINKAKAESEEVAGKLVEDIKAAIATLSANLQKLQEERA